MQLVRDAPLFLPIVYHRTLAPVNMMKCFSPLAKNTRFQLNLSSKSLPDLMIPDPEKLLRRPTKRKCKISPADIRLTVPTQSPAQPEANHDHSPSASTIPIVSIPVDLPMPTPTQPCQELSFRTFISPYWTTLTLHFHFILRLVIFEDFFVTHFTCILLSLTFMFSSFSIHALTLGAEGVIPGRYIVSFLRVFKQFTHTLPGG